MAKSWSNNVFDNGLGYIGANTERMLLLKGIPATYADIATNGLEIAAVGMAPADFTLADATAGGREVTVAAKSGATASGSSVSGDDLHIALVNDTNSELIVLTDETSNQVITAGNPVNFPSFKIRIPDPV